MKPEIENPAPLVGGNRAGSSKAEHSEDTASATDPQGGNRLPVLAAEVRKAHHDVATFTGMAAVQALHAGEKLVEAKALCRHGEWSAWVQSAGVSERSAQRYMLLFRSGLKPAIVADLGFAAAERYASLGMKLLPSAGQAACLAFGDDGPNCVGLGYWWHEAGSFVRYWCVQFLDDRECLHLNSTIPIWLLGAMELGRADRHDVYRLQPLPRADAIAFVEKFEASA